jgi:hypothetical protein
VEDDNDDLTSASKTFEIAKSTGRCSKFWQSRWCYPCRKFVAVSALTKVIIVISFLLFLTWAVFSLFADTCIFLSDWNPPEELPDPVDLLRNGIEVTAEDKRKRHFEVQFHGDSLILDPEWKYNFHNNIHAHLRSYNFTITNYATLARQMVQIIDSVVQNKHLQPDAYIILGDYNVANIEFDEMKADHKVEIRDNYVADLRTTLVKAKEGDAHVAICSTGSVLTEGPLFAPDTTRFQRSKQFLIREYTAINEATAADLDVTFIDIRSHFLPDILPWRLCYKGICLCDTERLTCDY